MEDNSREIVILLHGIGRTPFDMLAMAIGAKNAGFRVRNWGYRSRRKPILELASELEEEVQRLSSVSTIHFVGHSMGGLVARALLATRPPDNVGRLVMIGTPNAGSCVAEFLGEWWLYKKLMGPAGQDLRSGPRGIARTLGIPQCEFGIIAGGTGKRWGMNPFIPGDNDATVAVAETYLDGALDFLLLPYPHPFIQSFPRTIRNTIHFLRHGHFLEGRRGCTCHGSASAS